MFRPDDPFVKFLQIRKEARVYLKPYWGNSGDELIWLGTEVLLQELGVARVLNPNKADIILWPGGNPTMWEGNLAGWRDCWTRWPNVEFVVAPATFQGKALPWRELLKTSQARITGLFARDPESHENLLQLGLPATVQVGLGHDPAFHLKDTPWIRETREAGTAEYILASFRDDHESSLRLPTANRLLATWPLSALFYRYRNHCHERYKEARLTRLKGMTGSKLPVLEQDASGMSFQAFVECVNRAAQVHTDRLHCMILALLLGKEVIAYPTAYGKLEGLYEHSISQWAKVRFVSASTAKPMTGSGAN